MSTVPTLGSLEVEGPPWAAFGQAQLQSSSSPPRESGENHRRITVLPKKPQKKEAYMRVLTDPQGAGSWGWCILAKAWVG